MSGNLRQNRTNVHVVVKTDPPKNFFAKNQGFIQFLLFVVTFLTLVASVYFSFNSLQISGTQLEQAKTQLELAQRQFDESLKQREVDKKHANRSDSLQGTRFNRQDSINKRSLLAIELQAKIAKSQYESQELMKKDIVYQNRPIFLLDSVKFDAKSNRALIYVQNVGKRPAKIVLTKIATYNSSHHEMYVNSPGLENTDLNEKIEVFFNVSTTTTYFEDPKTMYYLGFKY